MNNKTVKKQPRSTSPRPVNRDRYHASNRLQAAALIGNPLHSIFTSGNRSQSRNNRLLTNVTQIKDDCKRLHDKLERMQLESEAQCEELNEKLKQIDGKELYPQIVNNVDFQQIFNIISFTNRILLFI
jgi:hypothetical protein